MQICADSKHLTGPRKDLWTPDMKERLAIFFCLREPTWTLYEMTVTLCVEFKTRMRCAETYRMLQQLKLQGRLTYDYVYEVWYIPDPTAVNAWLDGGNIR